MVEDRKTEGKTFIPACWYRFLARKAPHTESLQYHVYIGVRPLMDRWPIALRVIWTGQHVASPWPHNIWQRLINRSQEETILGVCIRDKYIDIRYGIHTPNMLPVRHHLYLSPLARGEREWETQTQGRSYGIKGTLASREGSWHAPPISHPLSPL